MEPRGAILFTVHCVVWQLQLPSHQRLLVDSEGFLACRASMVASLPFASPIKFMRR